MKFLLNESMEIDQSAFEKMTLVGTHDSMTYLEPSNFFMEVLSVFAKTQKHDIWHQLEKYDCIDLRVSLKKDSEDSQLYHWQFRHGLVSYEHPNKLLYQIIDKIKESYPYQKVVRIILEKGDDNNSELRFGKLCQCLETYYPEIIFIGGRRKSDWKLIYQFKHELRNYNEQMHQHTGSMAKDARWYEKIIPRFYARRMNKKNLSQVKDTINIFDFLD